MNAVWTEWLDAVCLPAGATLGVGNLGSGVLIEVVARPPPAAP